MSNNINEISKKYLESEFKGDELLIQYENALIMHKPTDPEFSDFLNKNGANVFAKATNQDPSSFYSLSETEQKQYIRSFASAATKFRYDALVDYVISSAREDSSPLLGLSKEDSDDILRKFTTQESNRGEERHSINYGSNRDSYKIDRDFHGVPNLNYTLENLSKTPIFTALSSESPNPRMQQIINSSNEAVNYLKEAISVFERKNFSLVKDLSSRYPDKTMAQSMAAVYLDSWNYELGSLASEKLYNICKNNNDSTFDNVLDKFSEDFKQHGNSYGDRGAFLKEKFAFNRSMPNGEEPVSDTSKITQNIINLRRNAMKEESGVFVKPGQN